MYGVILWSDQGGDRSIIWCEDHGNLAFWSDRTPSNSHLKKGDLVSFDVVESDTIRNARNVCLVAAEEYPDLAGSLLSAKEDRPKDRVPDLLATGSACPKVVPFPALAQHDRQVGLRVRTVKKQQV